MPKAYQYVRMSTERQIKGDSLRRQLEASEKYAADNGLTIDTTLKLQDIGLSGFSGANIEKGTLGKFLGAIRSGKVERGSTLIIESLDRLSRQKPIDQLPIFLEILKAGITIATTMDGRTYVPGKVDTWALMESILVMSRANEESARKQDRSNSNWTNKRANASNKPLTKICPGWLEPHKDGFKLIPERVETVRRIFSEAADLGMGIDLIARRLNKDEVPTFGRSVGWHISYLWKVLTNRAVLGEFQPHTDKGGVRTPIGNPVPDYFPRIIEDDLFYRAQAAREARRKGGGGRKGTGVANLFSGLLRCGTCYGPIYYQPNLKLKGGRRLICGNARRGMTDCWSGGWPYDHFETACLSFLKEVDLEAIALKPDNETTRLADAIRAKEGELVEARSQLEKAFSLATGKTPSKFLAAKFEELDAAVARLETELEQIKNQQLQLTQHATAFEEGKSELSELVKQFQSGDEAFELRTALSFHLKSVVGEIYLYPKGERVDRIEEDVERHPEFADRKSEMLSARMFFMVLFKEGTFRFIQVSPDDPTNLLQMAATNDQ